MDKFSPPLLTVPEVIGSRYVTVSRAGLYNKNDGAVEEPLFNGTQIVPVLVMLIVVKSEILAVRVIVASVRGLLFCFAPK